MAGATWFVITEIVYTLVLSDLIEVLHINTVYTGFRWILLSDISMARSRLTV